MISSLSGAANGFLAAVDGINDRLSEANSQITSGKRISVASDAPDQISALLQLRSNLAQTTQTISNLSQASTEAKGADSALSTAITLMDRALTLASAATSSTQDADTRTSTAKEIESIMEEMVNISQTTVKGVYIFSGDAATSPSYSLDLTATNGVTQLSTSTSTKQIADSSGGTFDASETAQEIFDATNADGSTADDNVFAALSTLRTALLNNDTDALPTAISSIKAATTHLNSALAFYGSVENRISDATSLATSKQTEIQTGISNIEDTDVVAAATELTQANTALEAAMAAEARMPTKSLFSYLG